MIRVEHFFEYFSENHLRSELGDSASSPHFHRLSLGKLKRYPLRPIEEAARACELIANKLKQPTLCLSGGLDSEAMAHAFIKAKVPFKAAIMSFADGLNQYDVTHALDFCREHSITHQLVELDAVEILNKNIHLAVAEKYRTLSPERALFILFLQKVEGEPVLAGEILRQESPGGVTCFQCPKDRDFSYWRYLQSAGRKGIPYFHYYTPELALSFMAHTRAGEERSVQQNWDGRTEEFYQNKLMIYRDGGFDLTDRPERKQKWHGFEGLKIHFDSLAGSTDFYNDRFRRRFEPVPIYDLNQFFCVDEDDQWARQVLLMSNAV